MHFLFESWFSLLVIRVNHLCNILICDFINQCSCNVRILSKGFLKFALNQSVGLYSCALSLIEHSVTDGFFITAFHLYFVMIFSLLHTLSFHFVFEPHIQ